MSGTPILNVRVESAADRDRKARWRRDKTRSFGASLVAFTVVHEGVWEFAKKDPLRPVFALFATSRQEEGPFVANLRRGSMLRVDGLGSNDAGHPMEFLKSAGYCKPQIQRTPHGSLIEVYVEELYGFKPGMIPEDVVRFVIGPRLDVLQREATTLPSEGLSNLVDRFPPSTKDGNYVYDPSTVVAEGCRFAATLNNYTRLPLPVEPIFSAQLLLSALYRGYAVRSNHNPHHAWSVHDRGGFFEIGAARAKRAPGLLFQLSQDSIAGWLAEEVAVFRGGNGPPVGLLAEIASYRTSLLGERGFPTKKSKAFELAYEDARISGKLGREAFDLARRLVEQEG